MAEISDAEKKVALKCITIIDCHLALNDGEMRLLGSIMNDIRLAFDLKGAAKPALFQNGAAWVPRKWFW